MVALMDDRPLRLYLHTFVADGASLHIARTGQSPCRAKSAAYVALEETLRARPELPRNGWRLLKQEDVTHMVT